MPLTLLRLPDDLARSLVKRENINNERRICNSAVVATSICQVNSKVKMSGS